MKVLALQIVERATKKVIREVVFNPPRYKDSSILRRIEEKILKEIDPTVYYTGYRTENENRGD